MIEHKPVLVERLVEFFEKWIDREKDIIICDFTVGFGGHSKALLEKFRNIKIVACDRDEESLNFAKENLRHFKDRVSFFKINFGDFDKVINFRFHAAILDLGVNSYQLLSSSRGFSFNLESRLDMRMDKTQELSAWEIVNRYSFNELKNIFVEYGEIKRPDKVVKAIIEARKKKRIDTCKELSEIITSVIRRRGKIHPATKFFQAIRIEVNQELEELKNFLEKVFNYLYFNGLITVITFHSIEDRIVKLKFKQVNAKILTKKPVIPDYKEIKENPRSRSAKLRVAQWTQKNC